MDNKFLKRPNVNPAQGREARFSRFGLRDNPFPSEPFVNRNSTDSRINGDIYEATLRSEEHSKLTKQFLAPSRSEFDHLRLGYIEDTSYLGRGNGKSAFILNATEQVNKGYCLGESNGANKCFSLILNPLAGGKTKTFDAFVDLLMKALHESDFIDIAIGSLVMEVLAGFREFKAAIAEITNEAQLKSAIYNPEWYKKNEIDPVWVREKLSDNPFLREIAVESPLGELGKRASLFDDLVSSKDCLTYYMHELRRGEDRLNFVFNDLTLLFLAAGFNGGFIFVDDFERIPDFQSARQKKDFAIELRSILFDGPYVSSTYGFYTFLLVLHAGVPRLINDAWQSSGISSRSPIGDQNGSHVIAFEKLGPKKIEALLTRYLEEFRTDKTVSGIAPFAADAVVLLAESCEFNAGKILSTCHRLLDFAATNAVPLLDRDFVKANLELESSDVPSAELKGDLSSGVDLLLKSHSPKAEQ